MSGRVFRLCRAWPAADFIVTRDRDTRPLLAGSAGWPSQLAKRRFHQSAFHRHPDAFNDLLQVTDPVPFFRWIFLGKNNHAASRRSKILEIHSRVEYSRGEFFYFGERRIFHSSVTFHSF